MSDSVRGTCMSMCPDKERWMREREGLLHVFEIDERTKHLKRPKADPSKIVKCFTRSAAGQLMSNPSELRSAPILLTTIKYLFSKVVTRDDFDWVLVYDFVFNRLRAIRQEMVIQRIGCTQSIKILEPIVRFHTYAAQRLCEKEINVFDSTINDQHLLECLKVLLVLYDERERQSQLSNSNINKDVEETTLKDARSQMEAVYILLNLGDSSSLSRGLLLPEKYRNKDVKLAMKISLAWYLNNYVRACRLIRQLSPLLACAALCNLRRLRSNALKIMSRAYNSRHLTFPSLKLQEILLYKDIDKISQDCDLFGLSFEQQNVRFESANFKKVPLATSEMYFNLRILTAFLPDILFQTDTCCETKSCS